MKNRRESKKKACLQPFYCTKRGRVILFIMFFIVLLTAFLPFAYADLWTGYRAVNSWQDTFDRTASTNLGENWTETDGGLGLIAEIIENALRLPDNSAAGNVRVYFNESKTFINQSYAAVEINFSATKCDNGGDGFQMIFHDEDLTKINRIQIAGDEIRVSGTKIGDCVEDTWYVVTLEFDWANDVSEIWLDGIKQANKSFENSATKLGRLTIYTGDNGYTGNWTIDYYQMGYPNYTYYNFSVVLNSPTNNTYSSSNSITFNATSHMYYLDGTVLKNATLYVWQSNGTTTTNNISITGNMNNTIWSDVSISQGWAKWNVYTCSNNSISGCKFSPSNYTLFVGYQENSQVYNTTTAENSVEGFGINITYNPSFYSGITGDLYYNNTKYIGTKTGTGNNIFIDASVNVPSVATSPTNISFYWQIGLVNASGTNYFNTSVINQSVSKIYLMDCGSTTNATALNFTAYDEKNLSRIKPFSFSITLAYGSQDYKNLNYSFTNTSAIEKTICIYPASLSFYIDGIVEYGFENENISYMTRNYYFQDALVNNITQNISLYLLDAEDSTSFIIKVQDQQLSPVTDALVYIQRYYAQDGIYRTVQISKTDDNGETVGFYETETADYKHIIMKDGEILLETSAQKVVGKDVPYTLTFTVGDALDYPWTPWEEDSNIQTSLTYNDTSKMVTFTYIDITGATTLGRLLVVQESSANYTTTTICNTSSTQSSATLTCNMTGYSGSFIAKGIIETEDNVVNLINFIITTAREIFGNAGVIIGWMIILTSGFAFFWNPTAGVIGINASLWFVSMIGFITFSPIFLFAIMGVSIIILILLKT